MENVVPPCLLLILIPACWAGVKQEGGGGGGGGGAGASGADFTEQGHWVKVRKFFVPNYVALGKNATLECDYQIQKHATLYSLKWYKGNSQFYQYIPSKEEQHVIYSVEGIRQEQVIRSSDGRRVVIMGIEAAASDTYRCEMVAEGPPFHTTQRSANMTVAVVPDERPLLTGSREYYHLHDLVLLNCTAPFAKPPITLTWYINDREANESSVRVIEHLTNPAELESLSTQLSLRVTHHHFKRSAMSIKCVGRLANLYLKSSQVTIREPSSHWFITSDLYHTSGCSQAAKSRWLLEVLLGILVYVFFLFPSSSFCSRI